MPRLRWVDGRMTEEPLSHELPAGAPTYAPPVALPEHGWTDGARSIRDTREEVAANAAAYTDGSPAGRAWAEAKATQAARRFTRTRTQ